MKRRGFLLGVVASAVGSTLSSSSAWAEVTEVFRDLKEFEPLPPLAPAATDWPWWRGPTRDGVAAPTDYPLEFSPDKNVVWKADLPGRGHGSPIVSGKHVIVPCIQDDEKIYRMAAFDRETGRALWKTECHRDGFLKHVHRKGTHADATPACDGERIFNAFIHKDGLWITALDMAGKILWQQKAGDFDAYYGFGMSPVLWGPLVIVCGDNDGPGAFLAALHRKTGEVVWRVKRPLIDTYGTPTVAHVAGKDQVIVGGGGYVWGYEPATGKLIWKCIGPTEETTSNTVAWDKDTIYVSGGYPTPYTLIAVKADGQGDVSKTHLQWTVKKFMPYVPSPLFYQGLLYIISDEGIASCLDPKTGKSIWTKRLQGRFSASPIVSGNRIMVCNEEGEVFILEPGKKFNQLAANNMGEGILASPAISGNLLFIRVPTKLYCIGAGK